MGEHGVLLSYCPVAVAKTTLKRKVLLWLTVGRRVHYSREVKEPEKAGHSVASVRKKRAMSVCVHYAAELLFHDLS